MQAFYTSEKNYFRYLQIKRVDENLAFSPVQLSCHSNCEVESAAFHKIPKEHYSNSLFNLTIFLHRLLQPIHQNCKHNILELCAAVPRSTIEISQK